MRRQLSAKIPSILRGRPLLLGLIFLISSLPAVAEIMISKVESGPQFTELESHPEAYSSRDSPLRIKNSTPSLIFRFHQEKAPEEEPVRLRYKLDGYDDKWRDLSERQFAKVSVQLSDQLKKIVGTQDFRHSGETAGWNGSIENSPFVDFTHQFQVPARTTSARIVVYGPHPDTGLGLMALDGCQIHITSQSGEEREIDLSLVKGLDLEHPLGSPENWSREGSGAGMAVLISLPEPTSRPVIAIVDTSASTYALWATDQNHRIPLTSGDQVTLKYRIAHSMGMSGSGAARYGQLEPGRYNFRVAAARINGELTGEEASFHFDIMPPLYQRWEYWTVIGLILVAALAWIRKIVAARMMREKLAIAEREKALEIERSRIARDLHDDIGAGLTEIAMQSDLVKQEIETGTTTGALQRIDNVCNSAIGLTRSVDEIVWAVNPANDTLDHFTNYLSQNTEEFLDAAGIRVRFQIPSNLPSVILPGKMRHNLYLAVREALNNLAKHASCNLVTLKVEYHNGILKISVQDNGCGFTVEEIRPSESHLGLANMSNRMNEIGGSHQITSDTQNGTLLTFSLPVTDIL